jgi:thiamine biosynthesis lipoprotein
MVDLPASTIRFTQPGVRIDLGGIAKGYAVDTSIALLQARGITNATVTAGGDSRILGDRRGRPWVVGIRHPTIATE